MRAGVRKRAARKPLFQRKLCAVELDLSLILPPCFSSNYTPLSRPFLLVSLQGTGEKERTFSSGRCISLKRFPPLQRPLDVDSFPSASSPSSSSPASLDPLSPRTSTTSILASIQSPFSSGSSLKSSTSFLALPRAQRSALDLPSLPSPLASTASSAPGPSGSKTRSDGSPCIRSSSKLFSLVYILPREAEDAFVCPVSYACSFPSPPFLVLRKHQVVHGFSQRSIS